MKKKLTCKDCGYLVKIPDGLSGKKKPSCCFFHEKHNLESDEIQKDCGLFKERDPKDKFTLE